MKLATSLTSWAVILLLALLLAGCGPAQDGAQGAAPTPTPLPTPAIAAQPRYRVTRGTVDALLETVGRVSAVREQSLFFRRDGFVDRLVVTAGGMVEEGALLAELDVAELEGQLAQARLALERAETVLELAEAAHKDALEAARLALEAARTARQQAQAAGGNGDLTAAGIAVTRAEEALAFWQAEQAKALDRPWEPEAELERYAREVRTAEQNLQIARAQYNDALGRRNSNGYQVTLQETEVQKAELELARLERGVDPLLALDVEQARLDLAGLEARLVDAQLVAPFAGQLLQLGLHPGDAVAAYDPVAVLADPSQVEVTLQVDAEQLSRLGVGMAASVQLRSRPGETLPGTIDSLPAPPGSDVGDDRRVHVALERTVDLEVGELATVTIVLAEREDVLWLPPAALRTFQGRHFVVLEEADGRRRVDVRLGISGESRVEILEGVEEGEVIVGE